MHMVTLILRVVELDEKRRAVNPVVMKIAFVEAAGPGEVHLDQARVLERLHEALAGAVQRHSNVLAVGT